jgi:hypothetical protein
MVDLQPYFIQLNQKHFKKLWQDSPEYKLL